MFSNTRIIQSIGIVTKRLGHACVQNVDNSFVWNQKQQHQIMKLIDTKRWSSSSNSSSKNHNSRSYNDSDQNNKNNDDVHTATSISSLRAIESAKKILGLPVDVVPTMKDIRIAYFHAAKQCHPDTQKQSIKNNSNNSTENNQLYHLPKIQPHQQYPQQGTAVGSNSSSTRSHKDRPSNNHKTNKNVNVDPFLQVTDAYELLQASIQTKYKNDEEYISIDEEEQYRWACECVLGLSAEIVEESKQNPMFRQWLLGGTDGAFYWRTFFSMYGGLAPKLRQPKPLQITQQSQQSMNRRRRKLN